MKYDLKNLYRVSKKDLKQVATTLSKSFKKDPLCCYIYPDTEKRLKQLYHYFIFRVRFGITHGEVFTPTIKADYTLTLALPKRVFRKTKVKEKIGKLLLADISVPYNLYEEMGLKVEKNLFRTSSILEVKL